MPTGVEQNTSSGNKHCVYNLNLRTQYYRRVLHVNMNFEKDGIRIISRELLSHAAMPDKLLQQSKMEIVCIHLLFVYLIHNVVFIISVCIALWKYE